MAKHVLLSPIGSQLQAFEEVNDEVHMSPQVFQRMAQKMPLRWFYDVILVVHGVP